MPHIFAHSPRVCSLKDGLTPLMIAVRYSKSPGVVWALLNGKANVEATDKVRHLEDKSVCPTCTH